MGQRTRLGSADRNRRAIRRAGEDGAGQGIRRGGARRTGHREHTVDGFPADANRRVKNPRLFAGFTYGYNHPLLVQRVHDILTVAANCAVMQEPKPCISAAAVRRHLGSRRPAQCGDGVDRLLVDTAGFRFAGLTDYLDANFVPGIFAKYGDLPALLA